MVEKLKEQMLDQEEVKGLGFTSLLSVWLNSPQSAAPANVAIEKHTLNSSQPCKVYYLVLEINEWRRKKTFPVLESTWRILSVIVWSWVCLSLKKENMYNLCHQEQVSVAAQTQKEWLKGRINTKIDEGLKHVVLKKQTNALKWSVMWFNMLWTSVTPPQKKMVYSLFLPQIYSEQVCFPAYAT